ncbi:MAG TPA: CpsB/CapC family capsule biosynthesis tyrosine phosphatase, partial [Chryseosolibacter sp.]
MMFNWLKKSKLPDLPVLRADMHSHLLAGLDDGVSTVEEAEEIILNLMRLGYRRIITTPHVMSDAYRNTPEGIQAKLQELRDHLRKKNIDIDL